MRHVRLDIENLKPFITDADIDSIKDEVARAHKKLVSGSGAGSEYLGWLDLPSSTTEEYISEIQEAAEQIRGSSDAFVTIGIGGSYLGARAAVEFCLHSFSNLLPAEKRGCPEIYFAGQNVSSDYLLDLLDIIGEKRLCLNVISKSGTTLEPAAAFRVLSEAIEKRHGREEAKKRIFVTTDRAGGALKELADAEGFKTFTIPANVGGRYSALTAVGLLPMAAAGIDITEIIEGAAISRSVTATPDLGSNPSNLYAAARNLLYRRGKSIEILASFHPSLHYVCEWWKQLAGESEGKDGTGLYPASVDLPTDLHSMGQWIQEGRRIIFETFLVVENSSRELTLPQREGDPDGLGYMAGKSFDYINDKSYRGTAEAHRDGAVPNMTIKVLDRSPRTLGALFYFFESAIAVSGYLLGVNPFDQPGVELYKQNMFRLLGKP